MAYRQEFAQEVVSYCGDMCWKIIARLHGAQRFPRGGGIDCADEAQIYGLLRMHQFHKLEEEMRDLLTQVHKKQKLAQRLLE